MAEKQKLSRRGFIGKLAYLISAIPFLWFIYKYLSPNLSGGDIIISTKDADVPEGGAVIFPDKSIAVMKREGKVTAMSLVCTHLACTISLDGDKFVCPCHGSVFALDGTVIKGPAERRLDTYKTDVKDGIINVYNQVNA